MSVPVTLDRLRAEIETFESTPYLLTVSEDGRPHAVSVVVSWREDEMVMGAGNRSMANASARPDVSLLWPPNEPGGFSLIVDATVSSTVGTGEGDNMIAVELTRAVLHRAAVDGDASGADGGSECTPVFWS
jgi:hypothetical protein